MFVSLCVYLERDGCHHPVLQMTPYLTVFKLEELRMTM